jgi:8-oxo-dGTP pyrophosphatase MutT (NUDIX family)
VSDEFWLKTPTLEVLRVALREVLEEIGMRGESSLSWPDAHPSVIAFGGNVQFVEIEGALLITLNGIGAPGRFVEALAQRLLARGIEVHVDEA